MIKQEYLEITGTTGIITGKNKPWYSYLNLFLFVLIIIFLRFLDTTKDNYAKAVKVGGTSLKTLNTIVNGLYNVVNLSDGRPNIKGIVITVKMNHFVIGRLK